MIAKKFKLPIDEFPKNHLVILRNDFATFRLAPNTLRYNRLGVNFKAKAFKTAVSRNRLRRAVFNFFRLNTDFLHGSSIRRKDLLITLNPAILSLTKKELEENFEKYVRIIQ